MKYDVLVCGAGPVGLMLAAELRLHHLSVLVVDRLAEPDLTVKAGSITTPTAEAFYRRGLLPALDAVQQQIHERMRAFLQASMPSAAARGGMPRFVGHFAGIMLFADQVDSDDPVFMGHGPAATVSLVPQQEIERVLAEHVSALGVELRRGVELCGFTTAPDGLTVDLGNDRVEASWLVGCDGGRSTVRKLAGFDFPGTDPEITGHQAVVELRGAEDLRPGWNRTDTGVYVHGPIPGRILTVEYDGPPADRDTPVSLDELQASLRHVSGTQVEITRVVSATRFTDNARQASTYRLGRVLLAGDAAHVHSPFGGQGLNLGIGDAMNLGWKLAATVQGWAPAGLLDTYTTERHPIGAWVLDWTRAQVALMRPEPRETALRRIVDDLLQTRTGTTYAAARLSGVWQHYALSDAQPLVGRSAPDLELADGSHLADHCHGGRAVLLDLADSAALRRRAAGWRDRLELVTTRSLEHPELTGMLVRPDGYVAWAGADELESLDGALRQWLGEPALVAA